MVWRSYGPTPFYFVHCMCIQFVHLLYGTLCLRFGEGSCTTEMSIIIIVIFIIICVRRDQGRHASRGRDVQQSFLPSFLRGCAGIVSAERNKRNCCTVNLLWSLCCLTALSTACRVCCLTALSTACGVCCLTALSTACRVCCLTALSTACGVCCLTALSTACRVFSSTLHSFTTVLAPSPKLMSKTYPRAF